MFELYFPGKRVPVKLIQPDPMPALRQGVST